MFDSVGEKLFRLTKWRISFVEFGMIEWLLITQGR